MSITVSNRIPPPHNAEVEGAVREAIADLAGDWLVTLLAEAGIDEYVVKVRRDDGPTWKWVFADVYEQRPEVIRERIGNGLRERIRQLVQARRNELLDVVRKHGGSNVRLFGSQARGDSQPDSDLDVLLKLEQGRSLFDLIDIKLDLQKLLGCKVDVVTEDGLRPEARDRILSEAVPL